MPYNTVTVIASHTEVTQKKHTFIKNTEQLKGQRMS